MYYISGGTVKQANKRFNTTGHDYEITIRNDSEVESYMLMLFQNIPRNSTSEKNPNAASRFLQISPCMDRDKIEQPHLSLNAVRLNQAASHVGEAVDIIAIIERVGEIVQV